ncbi:hypothetical protein M404DRAFT_433994 [Pisolithus tinctorius Marx 270]|uniref:Uncharacterized protein n=1 Tax=Pisolithus tinctorius Marx 270 TaxID=870435 RepID=A0A0C3PEB9_PISTI|nr:hypothetical protein M404DRAFT_433994 [Pisolithus tinctorius Marx 270]
MRRTRQGFQWKFRLQVFAKPMVILLLMDTFETICNMDSWYNSWYTFLWNNLSNLGPNQFWRTALSSFSCFECVCHSASNLLFIIPQRYSGELFEICLLVQGAISLTSLLIPPSSHPVIDTMASFQGPCVSKLESQKIRFIPSNSRLVESWGGSEHDLCSLPPSYLNP